MKHENLLQTYLANLAVFNVKLHNIHWNVVGKQFMKIHNYTEELYDALFESYDAVAELLKTKDVFPLSTMSEYLEVATIKEVKATDFSTEDSLKMLREDLFTMRALATDIRNTADKEGDFETVAMFEDYVAEYSKNIWFVDAMLK
ncbi:MAG: DNA starvation/stationary phase protection protein [Epulopiscium sp.]|nr:DNA starvation/stationary phase protection protein [Candidatus Epulonipiscium sp.]